MAGPPRWLLKTRIQNFAARWYQWIQRRAVFFFNLRGNREEAYRFAFSNILTLEFEIRRIYNLCIMRMNNLNALARSNWVYKVCLLFSCDSSWSPTTCTSLRNIKYSNSSYTSIASAELYTVVLFNHETQYLRGCIDREKTHSYGNPILAGFCQFRPYLHSDFQ